MREPILIEHVRAHTSQWDRAAVFARSFAHRVWPHLDLIVVSRGDRLIGFCQNIVHPISLTSWHTDPKVCSPRDFYEGSHALTEHVRAANHFGSVLLGVPEKESAITDQHLAKLGFEPFNTRLFLNSTK